MILAEPALAQSILGDEPSLSALAAEVERAALGDRAAEHSGRVRVVGCGSSDHAAQGVAALLDEAVGERGAAPGPATARQAFEEAVDPLPVDLLIAVSHEAETAATTAAMRVHRVLGARIALITANPGGSAAAAADVVITTPLLDRSWCHTVGFLSP